jgi:hypothetical protein
MTGTLNPACPLCGLRFANTPLLELHIRGPPPAPHASRPPRPGRHSRNPAARWQPIPQTRPGLQAVPHHEGVTAMTATRDPRARQMRTALQVRTAPRRAIRALRHVNDELLRASEAIIRSAAHLSPARKYRRLRPRPLSRIPPRSALTGPPDPPARAFPLVTAAPSGTKPPSLRPAARRVARPVTEMGCPRPRVLALRGSFPSGPTGWAPCLRTLGLSSKGSTA